MLNSHFTCNICGQQGIFNPVGDWREAPSCRGCGSSVRMRAVIHSVMLGLFGESLPLYASTAHDLSGVGLSDWTGYAQPLSEKFRYINSFYHQQPMLDIASPSANWINSADFLISSDVFEHVPVPAQSAFNGAALILKQGGLLVLTVPFGTNDHTMEHYPEMKDFSIAELGGEWVMTNRATSGELTVHRDLIFHGGPGTTLEMRLFSRRDIVEHLKQAGFGDIEFHGEDYPRWGIFHPHQFGIPVTAKLRMF